MPEDTRRIFVSYRRDESAGYAGRIADSLVEHFGEQKVFRDIDSLEPGLDFVEAIESALDSSEVLIAVIGRNWLTATDSAGQKRLENPDDYVRVEIATALRRNIRVIPLLVQGASVPSAKELPDDLAPLSRRNAFKLHDTSWRDDIRRLLTTLERVVGERVVEEERPVPPKPSGEADSRPQEDAEHRPRSRSVPPESWLKSLESWSESWLKPPEPWLAKLIVWLGLLTVGLAVLYVIFRLV
jgi:hypothetical protein